MYIHWGAPAPQTPRVWGAADPPHTPLSPKQSYLGGLTADIERTLVRASFSGFVRYLKHWQPLVLAEVREIPVCVRYVRRAQPPEFIGRMLPNHIFK